jgi:hypothetical protein
MKKFFLVFALCSAAALGCKTPSPQEYFGRAVLNCNLLFGFADRGLYSQLESPSVKLVDQLTMTTETMLREDVVREKIIQVETNYQKVKDLPAKDDSQEMVGASLALYELVLPVYKNEITKLAEMYDRKAPEESILATQKMISDTYADKFNALYQNVLNAGLAYAGRHNIHVQTTSPVPPR